MTGLLLHLAALFAVAWLTTSLLVTVLVRSFDTLLASIEPRARFRLMLAALATPLVVGVLVVLGVAFPHQWLGLVDHCLDHPGHLHLCFMHGAPLPQPVVLAFGSVAAMWSAARLITTLSNGVRSLRVLRRVVDGARVEGDLRVLPGQVPLAFTVGLFAPFVVVSEAVAAAPARWNAVLLHERAHVMGRDPLLRWLAELLTAFFAPFCGAELVARACAAQELAADEHAATTLGCRVEVASTLVEWMRARHAARDATAAVGFDSGPFALRVRRLLDAETYRSGPTTPRLLATAGALALALAFTALPLHHAVETVFGFLLS